MADLELYGNSSWTCPWTFHVMVALDELELPYQLYPLREPLAPDIAARMHVNAGFASTPCLVHRDLWLTESLAISEYLAETFTPPDYPRILPSTTVERARARQVMSWLRTSLRTLRDERPSTTVFLRPTTTPLGETARADANELIRVAEQLIPVGRATLCTEWSMADLDLALALTRLIANSDPVPQRMIDYAMAHWGRHSVRRYLSHIPTLQ